MLKWRVFSYVKHVVLLQRYAPKESPKCDVLVDESHIWVKRSNNSPSQKNNNSQQGAVVYHHAVLLSQNLWTKRSSERNLSAWQKSIDWGLAKFEGGFFFLNAVWFEHSLINWNFQFTGRHTFPSRHLKSVTVTSLPWLFGCLGPWVFTTVKLCQFNRTKSEGT